MINTEPAKTRSHNELIKEAIPTLAGTIAATLADPGADRFSEDDSQFIKFHGIYQQDDRDLRKTGKKYIFMVRGRLPGGLVHPDLYLAFDRLSESYGNQTLRVTSRQSFQFHGVVKSGLGPLMKGIHDSLCTTLAACGDVSRNVMAPSTPSVSPAADLVLQDAKRLSDSLLPSTEAYHAIWVDGVQLDLADPKNKEFVDPLYGKTYLPRKFKIGMAIPPLNDVDVFTHCMGLIAIVHEGRLEGYNLTAGGGMGMSHGNAETYPRVADVVGFLTPDQVVEVAKAVLTVHRDFGDRSNRKHARLKYVIAERGVDWFRGELEKRLGFPLKAAKPFEFKQQGDLFGWHQQSDGKWFLGLYIQAGRLADVGTTRLKTALRSVVATFRPEVRLTPSQNLLLAGIHESDRAAISTVLAKHGVDIQNQATALHRASMACVSLPTCGLALAESERFLPSLLSRLDQLLAETGLPGEEIVIRMTGCPNGCVRPYMAELGFVGKAPGKYQIYVGGNESSTRMNRLYRDGVREADLEQELRPVFQRFKQERQPCERFGDWSFHALR